VKEKLNCQDIVFQNILIDITYQFEDFELVEKNVIVGKIILSLRFFSNKGMLEHITGATIDRVTPQ